MGLEITIERDLFYNDKNLYFIAINDVSGTKNLSKFLGINYKNYIKLIIKNEGFKLFDWSKEYYFSSKKQCKNLIQDLEPYLIMKKLSQ